MIIIMNKWKYVSVHYVDKIWFFNEKVVKKINFMKFENINNYFSEQ